MADYPYCSIAELRAQIDMQSATDDAVLQALIITAGQAIDNFCGRSEYGFRANGEPKVLEFTGTGKAHMYVYEMAQPPALVEVKNDPTDTAYQIWSASDWSAFSGPVDAPNWSHAPYTGLMCDPNGDYGYFTSGHLSETQSVPTVRITANWGYSMTTPAVIKQACIIQVAQWFKRGEGAWAETINNTDSGEMRFHIGLDSVVKHLLVQGRLIKPSVGLRY